MINRFKVYKVVGGGFVEYQAWYDNVPYSLLFAINDDQPTGLSSEEFWNTFSTEQRWGIHAPQGADSNEKRIWKTGGDTFSNIRQAHGFRFPAKAAQALARYVSNHPRTESFNNTLVIAPLTPCEEWEQSRIRYRMELWNITGDQIDACLEDSDKDGDKSGSCMSNNVGKLWHIAWEVLHGIRREPTKENPIQKRVT